MHFPVRLSVLLAAATPFAHAQTTPPPVLADDVPVLLENVVVTASPYARSQAELLSATNVLSERDLLLQRQASLGETLSAQTGMSSTYFGPNASRPIIRGLGANRVRVLQNGTDTIDASNTSPDHAVSLEPFLVKRIEVVRGPAALLYGSAAVGGVVNVIDHRIETELPDRTVSGSFDANYGTNANASTYGGTLDLALFRAEDRAVVLHLDGFQRVAGDTEVPGLADPTDPTVRGRIPSTKIDADGGSIGVSYVSSVFDAGVNFNRYDSLYGVAEPGIEIDLEQNRTDFAAELKQDFGIFTGARLKAGLADYRHTEIAGGVPETTYTNQGYDGRLELLHGELAGFTGAWGVQLARSDFDAIGEEAFIPPSLTVNRALFLFEEAKAGDFTWQFGARLEQQQIDTRVSDFEPPAPGPRFPTENSRDDTTFSVSGGVIYAPTPAYAYTASVALTERAPNTQELFANGPHAGTGRFEIGDSNFDSEKSLGVELGARKRTGFVTGSFNLFANFFDGFIYEEDVAGSFLDEDGLPDPAGLQEARFRQRDALFYGAELETLWHLHHSDRHTLDLKLNADYTLTRDSNGDPLPRIAPLKGLIGLAWTSGPWSAGTDWQLVADQNRHPPGETDTDGYTLLSAYVSYRLVYGPVVYDLFARGSNLTDEEARMSTSFLKDIAPLPGRSLTLGLRASF
jgi:iron complex outermembrane recepter protein